MTLGAQIAELSNRLRPIQRRFSDVVSCHFELRMPREKIGQHRFEQEVISLVPITHLKPRKYFFLFFLQFGQGQRVLKFEGRRYLNIPPIRDA